MSTPPAAMEGEIVYPYLPAGRAFRYLPVTHPLIQAARAYALEQRGVLNHFHAAVLVRDGQVVAKGSIGEGYHAERGCERQTLDLPTGTGYDRCPGCAVTNHSEQRVVANAQAVGVPTEGADLYYWGHWWFCEPCWDILIAAGVRDVYLPEGSHIVFNKNHPDNWMGHQADFGA